MKITDVRAIYPNYRQPLGGWRPHLWQIVVRVETDAGVTGYGYGGGGIPSVEVVNRHLRELLLDERCDCPTDVERLWDKLYTASIPYGRGGIAIMALSGIDLALWDLLGRAESQPVYALLGGSAAPRIRAYASGDDPAWFAEQGFSAHKVSCGRPQHTGDYEQAAAMAEESRRHLGADALLMFDCYMAWDAAATLKMAQTLAPYDIHWFEDTLTPDDLDGLAALRPQIKPIQLAGGEHDFTHHRFAAIAAAGALDIWQPDVTWCGGVTATRRIIAQAQAAGATVVLHRGGEPWGLHVIAGTECDLRSNGEAVAPLTRLGELVLGNRHRSPEELWLDAPQPENGYLTPTDAPGFGLRLNEELLD